MKLLDYAIARPLGEGLVVAQAGGSRILVMNQSARFIWEQIANGVPASEIPALITDYYQIPYEQAQADFDQLLRYWKAQGLADLTDHHQRHYVLGKVGFQITCATAELEAAVAPVFSHLQVPPPPAAPEHPIRAFTLGVEDGQATLCVEGVKLCCASALDEVIEHLVTAAVMHAYDHVDWLVSVHAAAVGNDRACILVPGASGAGKTTLTAGLLVRHKLRYLTDDIALLDRADLHVVPVPGPLVLKRGSWPLLNTALPALASAPVYRRHGRDVRYWAPEPSLVAPMPLPVKAVVLPRRSDGAKAALTSLSSLEGLKGIIAAPATVKPPTTGATIDRLIQWARGVTFYALDYDDIDDAAMLLEELLTR